MRAVGVGVGVGREEGAFFEPRVPCQDVQIPAKPNRGRSSDSANQVGVLRGFVSAYSQNEVAGTMQRLLLPSQPRQCGLFTFRMFVTAWPPNCGGPGMPQRARTSSRSPSPPTRTMGASWSGKIAGKSGRLPVRSYFAAKRSRMADWPFVREYRLHMPFDYADIRPIGKGVGNAGMAASRARDG
jgi:hypothetical protein